MSLYKKLITAVNEENINYIYREYLTRPINGSIPLVSSHKIKIDGLLKLPDFSMLLEFKYDNDFTKRSNIIEVIIQIIYYLKQFEKLGENLPNVCFVGDMNECFYLHSNDVLNYLQLDIDWSLSPSTAGKKNIALFKHLYDDKNIAPYVHKLNDGFNIIVLLEKIIGLSKGTVQKEHVTEKNVNRLFNYFTTRIIRGKKLNKKTANELVSIFITTILNKDENYIHPHKPNTLITKSFGNIIVNGHIFKPFFEHYQMDFSLKERDKLTAICDRLIEDTTRRFKGEFFTPTEWVDEAHRMITEEFGADWKDKYIVWDPACYDDQTEVLTQRGWKFFKDLENDLIYSLNPYTNKGEWIGFHKKQIIHFNGNLLHFKTARYDLMVTPDHTMFNTERKHANNTPTKSFFWSANDTFEYLNRGNSILQTVSAQLDENNTKTFKHSNPIALAKLYGLYLGDGFVTRNNSNKEVNAINFKFSKKRKISYLQNILNDLNITPIIYPCKIRNEKWKNETLFRINDKSLFPYFESLFTLKTSTKEMHNEISSYSIETKLAIFDGLINSDGHVVNKTHSIYYTTSKKLADQIELLVIELGYNTKIRIRDRKNENPNYKTAYEISIINRFSTKGIRKKHISKVPYNGYVYDVTLNKNHILLVRRNGKSVFSGNCGTGNLTRDYKFKELYCSTLNQSDLDIMNQMNYNPEATKFQFDFLNDSDDKLPADLKKALEEGKQIIVLMNPPYGRSSGINKFGSIDKGTSSTAVSEQMRKSNFGMSSSQLYTQFLYHLMLLNNKNINIATFIKPLYLSGESFKKFRDVFLDEFTYANGMLFRASHFDSVSIQWGIEFSIWKPGISLNKFDFIHRVVDLADGKIEITGEKNIYNTDNSISLNKFISYETTIKDYPKLSSGLIVKDTKYGCEIDTNSFSTMVSNSNNVMENGQSVYIVNGGVSRNVGKIPVNSKTFSKAVAVFTARKTIKGDWINDKDEYLAPNTEHPNYEQWNKDCLVYALFNNSSNQSSLRDIAYKDKQWDIINEWFWMSQEHIQLLAEMNTINEVEQDIKNFGGQERFVYNKLQGLSLSEDAKIILDKAIELTENSFEYRKMMIEEYPEYHLNTWDAGWYQIKKILKKYMPDELKAFRSLYKRFEDRMREGVYKFGFLK